MSDIKITIDGKEYICHPVEETAAAKGEKKRTGYERVNEDIAFYDSSPTGVARMVDCSDDFSWEHFLKGNYYNDEQLAADIARAETLMRRIRQWQALNDKPVDWRRVDRHKYYIFFDSYNDILKIDAHDAYRDFGQIYFYSHKKAFEALEIFHDELMWYFTEYCQRLDEPRV